MVIRSYLYLVEPCHGLYGLCLVVMYCGDVQSSGAGGLKCPPPGDVQGSRLGHMPGGVITIHVTIQSGEMKRRLIEFFNSSIIKEL
eukprot:1325863-Pyramimonas_sp.AAC.1